MSENRSRVYHPTSSTACGPRGRRRPTSARRVLVTCLVLGLAAVVGPGDATARRSKYERRQRARGEVTDTSARLSTYAFINDERLPPWRLALFVDAYPARTAADPELLAVRMGLAREGAGPRLRLAPDRFRLRWEGSPSAARALTQEQLLQRPDGVRTLRRDRRRAAVVPPPVPFGPGDGLRVPIRFHADPSTTTLLNDDTELAAGRWAVGWLYFPVPADLPRREHRFELSFLGPGDEPLVTTAFRIEEDPRLHRRAFRRARKAERRAEKRERRRERAAARAAVGPR